MSNTPPTDPYYTPGDPLRPTDPSVNPGDLGYPQQNPYGEPTGDVEGAPTYGESTGAAGYAQEAPTYGEPTANAGYVQETPAYGGAGGYTQDAPAYGMTPPVYTDPAPYSTGPTDGTPSAADTAKDSAKQTADTAKQEAAQVKDTALSAGADVAQTAKEQAGQVVQETKAQAANLLDQARGEASSQASNQLGRLSETLHGLSKELGSMASKSESSGPMTDLVQQASQKGGEIAHWLSDREPSDVLEDVRRFARRRPFAFIGLAFAAGILAGRVTRGAVAANTHDSGTTPVGSTGALTGTGSVTSQPAFVPPYDAGTYPATGYAGGTTGYDAGTTGYESGATGNYGSGTAAGYGSGTTAGYESGTTGGYESGSTYGSGGVSEPLR